MKNWCCTYCHGVMYDKGCDKSVNRPDAMFLKDKKLAEY